MGIAALIIGCVGVVFAILPSFSIIQFLGILMGVVALLLGSLDRKKAIEEGESRGLATAGMVVGIIAIVLSVAVFVSCQYCFMKVGAPIGEGMSQGMEELRKKIGTK
ncbi:MAG: hypothetical protein V1754_02045 [Pseudomonadota bacterium]